MLATHVNYVLQKGMLDFKSYSIWSITSATSLYSYYSTLHTYLFLSAPQIKLCLLPRI